MEQELKDKILAIIKDAFENHVYSCKIETFFGSDSQIEGKEDFLKDLNEKLDNIK